MKGTEMDQKSPGQILWEVEHPTGTAWESLTDQVRSTYERFAEAVRQHYRAEL